MSQTGIKIEKRAQKPAFSFDNVKKDKQPTTPETPTAPQTAVPEQKPQNTINITKRNTNTSNPPTQAAKAAHFEPKIEKPKSKIKLDIQFPKKEKSYTREDAEEFYKIVLAVLEATETKKISDEQFIEMSSNLNRFKFSQRRQNENKPKPIIEQRNEIQRQEHKITSELNKLTIDNFIVIIDNLTLHETAFLQKNYLNMLATNLVKQASLQPLFSSLYSLSASSIAQVLNNTEYNEFRNAFAHEINIKAREAVKNEMANSSKFASDAAIGSASFYGFLTNREFVPIDEAYKLVKELIQNPTPANIEICRQLLIPSGQQIEKRFPSTSTEVFGKLAEISKDKSVPGSIRYPLIDLLEARSNNWDTKNLMHEIVSAKTSRAQSNLTQIKTKDTTDKALPTIKKAENKFAALLDDSEDEYEAEEEEAVEFNGNDMVRKYIIDNEISSSWRKAYIFDLLFAIALRPDKEITKAMRLLQDINDNNDFSSAEDTFDAILRTAQKCYSDEIIDDHPEAIVNCGAIFGRLVYFNCVTVDQFLTVFPIEKYNLDVTVAFLKEIIRVKKIDLLRESQIWSQYQWRPENCSHLDITLAFSEIQNHEIIFELFPLYDQLYTLYDIIDYAQNPEEGEEAPDLRGEIESFLPNLTSMPAFALGAIEILIKFYEPSYFEIVLPILADNQLLVLKWIEKYGIRELRETKKIVTLIQMVANYGKYKLNDFINSTGDERHKEIVQSLK